MGPTLVLSSLYKSLVASHWLTLILTPLPKYLQQVNQLLTSNYVPIPTLTLTKTKHFNKTN